MESPSPIRTETTADLFNNVNIGAKNSNNIGITIKTYAVVVAFLGVIISALATIPFQYSHLNAIGILIFIVGALASRIFYLFVAGYGDLIDVNHQQLELLQELLREQRKKNP